MNTKRIRYSDKELKNAVNLKGKIREPKFKFHSLAGRNSKNEKLVKIQMINSNKTAIRLFRHIMGGVNPFSGRGVPYSEEILRQKVNAVGAKSTPKYIFVRDTGIKVGTAKSIRIIEIKNQYGQKATAQLSNLMNGSNPWGNAYTLEEIKLKINAAGKSAKPSYSFVRDSGIKSGTDRLIEVKLDETGETELSRLSSLLRGTNPWKVKYSLKQIKNTTNRQGRKSNPQYKFLKYIGKNNLNKIEVKIQNIETKKTAVKPHASLLRGHNPWKKSYSIKENEIRVNQIGKKSSPKFRFKRIVSKSKDSRDWIVLIEEFYTKKTTTISIQSLLKGSNPFNTELDLHEKKVVHPKYKKLFKEIDLKFEYEPNLSKECKPDFVCTNKKGMKIIVETKSDKKKQNCDRNKKQIFKYEKEAKKVYGNKYFKTYITSPLGKYGLSIKKLKKALKQQGFI